MNMMAARSGTSLKLPAAYFLFALCMFIVFLLAAPWGTPSLAEAYSGLDVLAYVHTLTLGFVAAIVIGASYQLVPVLLETRLALEWLAWVSLAVYAPGVAIFLAAITRSWLTCMAIGGVMLFVGILCYIGCIAATVLRAQKMSVYGWLLLIAAAMGGIGVSMGAMLAISKGSGTLGADTIRWLGAHIVLMIAGWVGLTFITVATKLVAMFTLSEKWIQPRLLLLEATSLTGGVAALAASLLNARWHAGRLPGAVLITLAFVVFAAQLAILYRKRVRKAIDLHMPFAVIGTLWLILAAAATVHGIWQHRLPGHVWWNAVVFIALWGGYATVIQGFLIKIASFLLWLHRYAPHAGRTKVPGLQDLYHTRLAYIGLLFWTLGCIGACLRIVGSAEWLGMAGVFCLVVGGAAFLANMVAIVRHLRVAVQPEPVQESGWRAPHLQRASTK